MPTRLRMASDSSELATRYAVISGRTSEIMMIVEKAASMVLGAPLHRVGDGQAGQAKHGSFNDFAALSPLSTTLQSNYGVDLLALPPLLPDSGIGTHASGFAFPELALCRLSVCLLAFDCVQGSRLKQA